MISLSVKYSGDRRGVKVNADHQKDGNADRGRDGHFQIGGYILVNSLAVSFTDERLGALRNAVKEGDCDQ